MCGNNFVISDQTHNFQKNSEYNKQHHFLTSAHIRTQYFFSFSDKVWLVTKVQEKSNKKVIITP